MEQIQRIPLWTLNSVQISMLIIYICHIVQLWVIITRSNITWYCIQFCSYSGHYINQSCTLKDDLCGVYCEDFEDNWPCYKGICCNTYIPFMITKLLTKSIIHCLKIVKHVSHGEHWAHCTKMSVPFEIYSWLLRPGNNAKQIKCFRE